MDITNAEPPRKRGRPALPEPYKCICDYSTNRLSNFNSHKSVCKVIKAQEKEESLQKDKDRFNDIKEQLAQANKQLAEKDEQIKMLIKHQRNSIQTQNNVFIVAEGTNLFGRESSVSEQVKLEFLKVPEDAVAKLIAFKHSMKENRNVMVPNVRDSRWLVVEDSGGEKQWQSMDKSSLLETMWENNVIELEGAADENTSVGGRFLCWSEKVKEEQGTDGKLWKSQMRKVENVILDQRARLKHSG